MVSEMQIAALRPLPHCGIHRKNVGATSGGDEMKTLKDKHAIVTGAGQGLGEAIAERLIQGGCRVMLADIQEEQVAKKTAELKSQYGDVVLSMKCDVTHEPDVESVVALAEKSWEGIDIFVANAGILIS